MAVFITSATHAAGNVRPWTCQPASRVPWFLKSVFKTNEKFLRIVVRSAAAAAMTQVHVTLNGNIQAEVDSNENHRDKCVSPLYFSPDDAHTRHQRLNSEAFRLEPAPCFFLPAGTSDQS